MPLSGLANRLAEPFGDFLGDLASSKRNEARSPDARACVRRDGARNNAGRD
jgi:hypothetical protein